MFGLGTTELIIIFGVIFLLFGAKKLPELAAGIGKSIKLFKKELSTPENSPSHLNTEENRSTGNVTNNKTDSD